MHSLFEMNRGQLEIHIKYLLTCRATIRQLSLLTQVTVPLCGCQRHILWFCLLRLLQVRSRLVFQPLSCLEITFNLQVSQKHSLPHSCWEWVWPDSYFYSLF